MMTPTETTHDLIVVGAGTGNYLFTPEFEGLRRAIIEPSRFGGTCLNRGCIPTKMFVVAADAAREVQRAGRLGIRARLDAVDWSAIQGRIFGRIDPMHEKAISFRRTAGVDVFTESARFIGPRTLRVGDVELSAPTIILATGGRPVVPPVPGLEGVEVQTSDSIMRIEHLPRSLMILGGGFIAAEMAHVFSSFGVAVTVLERGDRLLRASDREVAERFTEVLGRDVDVRLGTAVLAVAQDGADVVATLEDARGRSEVRAEMLLVATGRRPNSEGLDPGAGGLELDEHGHLVTDEFGATTAEGVWALGDLANHFQLKHLANAEARTLVHNVAHPQDRRPLPHALVPHAVFADPQIAGVGATQQQLEESGVEHLVSVRPYGSAAYGWALEDTSSFVKLLADPATRLLLGAHIIGPHAAMLIQPLIQAMTLGLTIDQIGREVIYIHPALTEVVEQALLDL